MSAINKDKDSLDKNKHISRGGGGLNKKISLKTKLKTYIDFRKDFLKYSEVGISLYCIS